MPWLIYQLIGGATLFPGSVLLVIAVGIGINPSRRWVLRTPMLFAVLGIAMVGGSATAIAYWVYGVWAVSIVAWVLRGLIKSQWVTIAINTIAILTTLAAAGMELRYDMHRTLRAGTYPRLYVIGDSISAGIALNHVTSWPSLIRVQHRVEVIDLSRAGCTLAEGRNRLRSVSLDRGLVVIELGGNDIIARVDPKQFGNDLDALIRQIQGPSRELVMFELPLPPFGNGYGIEQRRAAAEYHVTLIPRRYFADILSARGATLDGIHLTPTGQRRMADLVWDVVGASLKEDDTNR